MVGQVKVVAILMIVQGALALVMGLLVMGVGALGTFGVMASPSNPRTHDAAVGTVIMILYLIYGLLITVAAALNLFAGVKSLGFRGRTLALVALFANLIPVLTCYCTPTSLAVMIYGLIVMFQQDVAQAFQMGEEGAPAETIVARFSRPPMA